MKADGKLGVFDSGLGGLLMTRAIREAIPDIDILYFGDTLHLPYGNRSDEAIYVYTRRAMDAMFAQGCRLIVIACNTVSAVALRRLQQDYLRENWPGRNIIGIVVPTLEAALDSGYKRLGVIATHAIVRSGIYEQELCKIDPSISLKAVATPLLVPLIEMGGEKWIESVLADYLAAFDAGVSLDALILGCTHYPRVKKQVRAVLGEDVALISQDDILPAKVSDYLTRHPEYSDLIGRNHRSEFFVSDLTENYKKSAYDLYGHPIEIGVLTT